MWIANLLLVQIVGQKRRHQVQDTRWVRSSIPAEVQFRHADVPLQVYQILTSFNFCFHPKVAGPRSTKYPSRVRLNIEKVDSVWVERQKMRLERQLAGGCSYDDYIFYHIDLVMLTGLSYEGSVLRWWLTLPCSEEQYQIQILAGRNRGLFSWSPVLASCGPIIFSPLRTHVFFSLLIVCRMDASSLEPRRVHGYINFCFCFDYIYHTLGVALYADLSYSWASNRHYILQT